MCSEYWAGWTYCYQLLITQVALERTEKVSFGKDGNDGMTAFGYGNGANRNRLVR